HGLSLLETGFFGMCTYVRSDINTSPERPPSGDGMNAVEPPEKKWLPSWQSGWGSLRSGTCIFPNHGGTHGKEMCDLRHSPGYAMSRFCLFRPPQRKRRRAVRVLCDQRTG